MVHFESACSGAALRRKPARPAFWSYAAAGWSAPALVFLALSALFGPVLVFLTPPMRGPDEPAHFVRAYSLLQGDIIPSLTDAQGRKGIFIPADLKRQMVLFEHARERVNERGFSYPGVFALDARLRMEMSAESADEESFKRYDGSEGYSPVPYLPYLPALALARLLDMDFLGTVYLMRGTGFVLLTGLMAWAVFLVPRLQWAFMLIAMLPSAFFARATISGDGASLALAMLAAALALRGALLSVPPGLARGVVLTLCTLAKPPQIALALLELMRRPVGGARRRWIAAGLVMTPALALPVVWAVASEADVAIYRMIEGSDVPPEHFDPVWKIGLMIDQPLHFPRLLAASLGDVYWYWQQLIGVLGWLDAPLHPWLYPLLTLCLAAVLVTPLGAAPGQRLRIGALTAISALAYALAVFLIFYLVWTDPEHDRIQGVQGRYFVPVLPACAIALSALINRGLPDPARALIATFGATLSCAAVIEAVLRTDWKLALPSI